MFFNSDVVNLIFLAAMFAKASVGLPTNLGNRHLFVVVVVGRSQKKTVSNKSNSESAIAREIIIGIGGHSMS